MRPDWLTYEEAQARLQTEVAALPARPVEERPLPLARGRVLARPLPARVDLPPWTNSAVDGYAVRAADTAAAPVRLRLTGEARAGGPPPPPVGPGTAVRIATGAPLPAGADAVVRQEDAAEVAGAEVEVHTAIAPGTHVRPRGADVPAGAVALRAGTTLGPAALALAAMAGHPAVPVAAPPRVALLAVGDELVGFDALARALRGEALLSGNSVGLAAALIRDGWPVLDLGIVPDDPAAVAAVVAGLRGRVDALLTVAGVSVGAHDPVRPALQRFELERWFWRVRVRPGSPLAAGRLRALDGLVWFGLPGNPVSALVTYEVFVRPALRRWEGQARPFPRPVRARWRGELRLDPPHLVHFVRARLHPAPDGGWEAEASGAQGSHQLAALAAADGLALAPAGSAVLRPGQDVAVWPLTAEDALSDPPAPLPSNA